MEHDARKHISKPIEKDSIGKRRCTYIEYQWICNKPQHPTIILSERENPIQKNMDAQLKHATKSDLINKELKKYMPEQETKTDLQAKKQLAIRYLLSKS